ncbi:unnamed protein product [Closterium sp. NIES-64]|nr:unnamed protein product [Closterium sp. NIES-64]
MPSRVFPTFQRLPSPPLPLQPVPYPASPFTNPAIIRMCASLLHSISPSPYSIIVCTATAVPTPSQSGGGSANGAIAGIAVAESVAALVLLLLLTWRLCKGCRTKGTAGGDINGIDVNEMASKHHPNLVRLLGFCVKFDPATSLMEQVLVYEFMANRDLESWIGPDAVPVFKDPDLDAPDDLVLRWARLALSCTAMPVASRPSMNQVLGELVKLKQEAFGAHVSEAISRIDKEIGSSIGSSGFTAEMARAEREGMQSDSAASMS